MNEDQTPTDPHYHRSETGIYESGKALSVKGTGHSVKSEVNNDNSVNKTMPWVVLVAIIASVSLGLSIGAVYTANQARAVIDSAASDAKRIAEREARLTQVQLDDLKSQLRTQGFRVASHELP